MPHYTLKDGTRTSDRRLDRIPAFDHRMLSFPVRDALNAEQQTLVSHEWPVPDDTPVLDQGAEGACTGFGVTNELLYYPVAVRGLDATFAREQIYWVAQREDPWPGGAYPQASPQYEGTAVLYAVKAAADLGYYLEYRWATRERELALGVGYLGPAIIGIDWYEGMYEPDSDGFIHPTGNLVGGHCTLLTGIHLDDQSDDRVGYYTLHNSWGPGWGDNGNCKISRQDMTKLLNDNGEACIITQRAVPQPDKQEAAAKAEDILPSVND